jgi:peptidoglycan/xylan/chitin deacetylase (PgdA/CDA1 family)
MTAINDSFPSSRIPYPARAGLDAWPNGERIALLVYTAPEEWRWSESEAHDPPGTGRYGEALPSLSTRSAIEYGFRVGLHRLNDVFSEFDLKATLWTSGAAIEQHRDVIDLLVQSGHEIGAHGYTQGRPMTFMDREAQREAIAKSVELITQVTGKPPAGWVGPAASCDRNTIELLAEAGFDYHADLQDDELPYFLHVGERTLVEIPYRMIGNLNDLPLLTALRGVPKSVPEATEHFTAAFDAYHRAAQTRPLIINFGTHPHVSGRPDGAEILRRTLEHVRRHDDVWVCTFAEMAAWWRERFGGLVPAGAGDIDVTSDTPALHGSH